MEKNKIQALMLITLISQFSGFTFKEIANFTTEDIDSYVKTFSRSRKFIEN